MSRKRHENRPANVPDVGNSRPAAGGDPFSYASVAAVVFLLAAVFLVFGQTVRHGFLNYDDWTYVRDNHFLAEGSTIHKVVWAFTTNLACNWHPLTWISHLVDCSLYGSQNAGGHHLTNVLLHAATAIVLFLTLRRMTGDFWPSALAAALFAVHPLRVESVAWIAERKDVLSGLLFMLTLWAYAGYVARPFSSVRYFAVAAFFALGLLAKPTSVTLPFVLLLLDYWPLGRFPGQPAIGAPSGATTGRRLIVEKIPLVLLAAGSCMVTLVAQRNAIGAFGEVALPWRIGNAAAAYVAYLIQFFWPVDLAILYPHQADGLPLWKIAAALLVLATISAGVAALRRRSPYLVTGWLWYLGMLVPMVGLVQVGWQARADRYTYLPQIGVCIMLAWSVRQAAVSTIARRCAFVASATALALLMALAHRQTALWSDEETLWRHTLACTEKNYVAYFHLGMTMADRGHYDDAIEQYDKAKEIAPDYVNIHNNLGYAFSKTGRFSEAIAAYKRALEIEPKNAKVETNLGAAMQKQGALFAAISHYQEAVKLQPDYVLAQQNLATAMLKLRHTPAMLVRWREWIDLAPNDYVLLNEAAWVMAASSDASLRNGKDAVELARRAASLAGEREPTILATLAAAYAEAGLFSDAVKTARLALKLASQEGDRALAKSLEAKLPLYESQKPYHEEESRQ